METDPRQVVQRYFNAWTSKNVEEAYALLAPDLAFVGPTASYDSAEGFRPGLVGFAQMASAARIVMLVAESDRVAMLYDCDLPPPVGTLRIASFFVVRGGRIARYETQFDATEWRKLLAKR
jgi:ketosteroid isomerase-like protein